MTYIQIIFSQMTWILSGVGVPILVGVVILVRKWLAKEKHTGKYFATLSTLEIRLFTTDGRNARYTKAVSAISLIDSLIEIYDFLAVSGRSTLSLLDGIDPVRVDRFLGAAHRHYFRLYRPVNKNQPFQYKMVYDLHDTFLDDTEYWESEQMCFAKKLQIRVIFPKDRPYRSFRGLKRSSMQGDILPVDQPSEKNIEGFPCIEWNIANTKLKELHRIEWSW